MGSVEQLRIAAAPATFEVLEALQLAGPSTVRELGPRLGRKPNALHYHIRKLLAAGLIEQVDSRRSGARTEVIYDVTAGEFSGAAVPRSPQLRKATIDAVASLLRLATRNFAKAALDGTRVKESGPQRNMLVQRQKAWLTAADLDALNRHLRAIDELLRANHGTQRGQLCALTTVMTPLDPNLSN